MSTLVRVALLAATAALLVTCCGPGRGPKTRIVLITLDTLRYDSFAGPGGSELMPETRGFAERGLSFENHYATTSCTQPTHASLLTGLFPWEHGVTRNGVVLAKSHRTLAEELDSRGFRTHAVVASFPVHHLFGFAQGFDTYDDDFDEAYAETWEGKKVDEHFFSLSTSVTDKALEALDRARGNKQFFWFHYFDPHDPYGDAVGEPLAQRPLLQAAARSDPELEGLLSEARRLYGLDVQEMDRALGRLFRRLREEEGDFETHVILTADHGESLGELGSIGHGLRVTREQVHVPLVVVSPRLEPGTRTDLCSSVDIPRTVLSLLGVEGRRLEDWGGRDLLSDEGDGVVLGMRRTFHEETIERLTDGRKRKLIGDSFYTIRGGVLLSGDGSVILEEDDPDRVAAPGSFEAVRRAFAGLAQDLAAAGMGEEITDAEAQELLKALGYTR